MVYASWCLESRGQNVSEKGVLVLSPTDIFGLSLSFFLSSRLFLSLSLSTQAAEADVRPPNDPSSARGFFFLLKGEFFIYLFFSPATVPECSLTGGVGGWGGGDVASL